MSKKKKNEIGELKQEIDILDHMLDALVETLEEKIHTLEHRLYPEAIQLVVAGKLKLEGRRVRILL